MIAFSVTTKIKPSLCIFAHLWRFDLMSLYICTSKNYTLKQCCCVATIWTLVISNYKCLKNSPPFTRENVKEVRSKECANLWKTDFKLHFKSILAKLVLRSVTSVFVLVYKSKFSDKLITSLYFTQNYESHIHNLHRD